jgi:hypothetical protein
MKFGIRIIYIVNNAARVNFVKMGPVKRQLTH